MTGHRPNGSRQGIQGDSVLFRRAHDSDSKVLELNTFSRQAVTRYVTLKNEKQRKKVTYLALAQNPYNPLNY